MASQDGPWTPPNDPAPDTRRGLAGSTVSEADLVAAIAAESGQSQAAVASVVDSLFVVLAKSLENGRKVTIPGWLSIEATQRAARTGRNPATGETIHIAASKGVKISAGSKLKAAVK